MILKKCKNPFALNVLPICGEIERSKIDEIFLRLKYHYLA